MLAKWRPNSDQRNLGLKREFLRNLPTTPTRAAQLRKGLEPIFESDDRCCRRHCMAVGNVTDKTPASAEICNSTNRRVIDLGSHRPLRDQSGAPVSRLALSVPTACVGTHMKGIAMSRGDGSLFDVWQLGRRVRQITLLLPLTAGLFLLAAKPGFPQTNLMGGATGMAVPAPLSVGTESLTPPCPAGSPSNSSSFDGRGLTALSGLAPIAGVSTSGIWSASPACSTATTGASSSNDASAIAGVNGPLGATQLGGIGAANPMGSTSPAASAGTVPSPPCIGADSPARIAPSLSATGGMGMSSSSSAPGSTGRIPGSSIVGMGGTGEIPDPLNATNDDGISDYPTSCPVGPLGAMQLNLMKSTTTPMTSTANPVASTSPGANLSSSGMD
jgi:hypothetical protein